MQNKPVTFLATYKCYHLNRKPAQDFRWRMLRNGKYSAWFRTRQEEGRRMVRGEGTGVIELNDGKVTGGDTVLAYTGSYVVDGDKFTACIATERHTQGQPSVFGIDNFDLTVSGRSTPTMASCTGTAKQAPELAFEAVLIPISDEPSNAAPKRWARGPATPWRA
jgi:hypothetical protein